MKKTIFILMVLINVYAIWANQIIVNNVSLENFNESEGWVQIKCNISWQNSWRIDTGPSNWDAAWLFAKYRANGGPWSHVTLTAIHSELPDASNTLNVSNDNKGAFVYRATVSNGTNIINNLKLGWNLNTDDIDINDTIEVKVFAIEMVYVPEGSYYIGNALSSISPEVDDFNSQLITSEDEITVSYGTDSSSSGDGIGLLPADYPKGFKGFYCMKYEISEQQYIEWFNSLDPGFQTISNDITGAVGKNSDAEVNGNTIAWTGLGNNATTLAPDRACNYLSKGQFFSYLRWAGLRPMTELEYEKASRGPGVPVSGVYAWGSTNLSNLAYTILAQGIMTESVGIMPAVNEGRAAYNITTVNVPRPYRCGIFSNSAANTNGTRENAGASYYGIMELSGNVAERVVSVGSSSDRTFTAAFNATIGINGLRGGGWTDEAGLLRIADRTYGGSVGGSNINIENIGGRGVRSID